MNGNSDRRQWRIENGALFLLLTLHALLASKALLASSNGSAGAAFLEIPVGARPAALGSAYAALASDAYSPIYNPAGLGFVKAPQLAAQHLSYLSNLKYEFGSFVLPVTSLKWNLPKSIGASVQYLGAGDFVGTDESGNPTGNYSAHYAAYTLSYGQMVSQKVAVGASGKMIDASISGTSAKAYAGDLGIMYQPSPLLTFAATYTNLGTKLNFAGQGDPLPQALHIAASAHDSRNHFAATIEGIKPQAGTTSGRVGAEWRPVQQISLRAGYKTDTTKGLSAMAGLTAGMGLHLFGQEFSYAWLPYGDLGNTQYFSMLIKFGDKDVWRNLIHYNEKKLEQIVQAPGWLEYDSTEVAQLLESSEASHVAQAEHTTGNHQ